MASSHSGKKKDCKREAQYYACGLVPGIESVLELFGRDPYKVQGTQRRDLTEKAILLLSSFEETNTHKLNFLRMYPEWIQVREECIKTIRNLADNIDFHHRNTNIAQIPTSVVGLVGGALTVTGLALIPVTFGASLGLTIAGAVVGGGAAVAGVANASTDIGVRVHRTKKAKQCVDEHLKATQDMETTINELLKCCDKISELTDDENTVELAQAILTRNIGEIPRTSAIGLKNSVSVGVIAAHTIPRAAKSLHLLRKGLGISAAASASSLRTVDVASDVAVTSTKVIATTASKAAGFTLSAIGMAADVFTLGVTIYDLAKGSKTSSSKVLRKIADDLTAEMETVTKMLEILNGNA